MESLAAFGLVANIFQAVHFSASLLSTTKQILQAGSTVQNSELELVTTDIQCLNEKLKRFSRPDLSFQGPLTRDNQALDNLADETEKIANQLIDTLSGFQLDGDRTR